jgi:glycolate oxidase FAD binding subunit
MRQHAGRTKSITVNLDVHQPNASIAPSSHHPVTVSEVGEAVRQAAATGQAVYPAGGQTQWDLGLPPVKPGILLDTRRLDQVIDYPARDMTITVQAGITVARLQAILAEEKQRLPIDVPLADRATVGGTVATNVSGPRRFGWGTLRDYVIGISAVNDQGQEIKGGGRVVKNVAGYDLCKLFVGSLGTLGVITQITFKVRPCPSEQAAFAFLIPPGDLEAALTLLHASQTRPATIELLNPRATAALAERLHQSWTTEWAIVVCFEDNPDAIKWQVGQLIQELGSRHSISCTLGECADPVWQALIDFGGAGDGQLSFKAGVPPGRVAAFCLQAAAILEPMRLQAHAGNGIVVGHCSGDDIVAKLATVRKLATAAGGHLVVTRCPAAWKTLEFVWGPPKSDRALMRAVKEKLDPGGLFNPGRFVS